MGLYYTSFINKLKEKHKNFDGTLEEFLDNAGDIYEEYEVGEGSLHWALNMKRFFYEIEEEIPEKYLDMINEPLEENARLWDDFFEDESDD